MKLLIFIASTNTYILTAILYCKMLGVPTSSSQQSTCPKRVHRDNDHVSSLPSVRTGPDSGEGGNVAVGQLLPAGRSCQGPDNGYGGNVVVGQLLPAGRSCQGPHRG